MAGQEGFEPPTPGFGVRCSAVRATGLSEVPGSMSRAPQQSTRNLELGTVLLGFLMGGVLAAPTTVLTQYDPIRRILFILRRCVISPFAFTTS